MIRSKGREVVESTIAEGVSIIKMSAPEKQKEQEIKKLRVAAYCRVSKDIEQQECSMATQKETYSRLISEHPDWELAEIYADKGKTGTSLKKRANFNRMIADAEAGKIDMILVKSISRSSRNTVDMLETVRHLRKIGVGVFFEKEKIDTRNLTSELLLTVFAAFPDTDCEDEKGNGELKMRIRRVIHESETRKKNVAAYARVSTLGEEQNESFETQVSYFTAFIDSVEHWSFAGVYADHGKSGLSAQHRPEFMRMIADAMDKKIDIILVKSISRFGRNSLEAQTFVHQLKEKGVEERFERESISSFNPQSDMIFNFLVAVAQEESKSISQNVRWTYEKLAEQGIRHLGNNHVLGYDEVQGVLTPNKDAWVVQLIFEEYVNGKSMREIADILQKKGFVTMRGKEKLAKSTIAGILRNEIYKGDRLLQKQPPRNLLTHKPDFTQEYISRYIQKNHEPIVSPELWEQAQMVLNTPKDHSVFPNKRSHPLRGKVICGECGSNYYRVTRSTMAGKHKCWVCADRRAGKKGKGYKNSIIREEKLLEILKKRTGVDEIGSACGEIEHMLVFGDGRVEVEILFNKL